MKKLHLSETDLEKLYQEYAEGVPISTLAVRYNVKESTLRKYLNEYR